MWQSNQAKRSSTSQARLTNLCLGNARISLSQVRRMQLQKSGPAQVQTGRDRAPMDFGGTATGCHSCYCNTLWSWGLEVQKKFIGIIPTLARGFRYTCAHTVKKHQAEVGLSNCWAASCRGFLSGLWDFHPSSWWQNPGWKAAPEQGKNHGILDLRCGKPGFSQVITSWPAPWTSRGPCTISMWGVVWGCPGVPVWNSKWQHLIVEADLRCKRGKAARKSCFRGQLQIFGVHDPKERVQRPLQGEAFARSRDKQGPQDQVFGGICMVLLMGTSWAPNAASKAILAWSGIRMEWFWPPAPRPVKKVDFTDRVVSLLPGPCRWCLGYQGVGW